MSFVSRIIGTITFNRGTLKKLVQKDEATGEAWLIIFFGSALAAILGALAFEKTGDPQYLGFASYFASDVNSFVRALLVSFAFQFLLILFLP